MRPRNFDIAMVQRAAAAIAIGPEGLWLRLVQFECHLDRGETNQAAEALREAMKICDESASLIPAVLHTDLIFGASLVLRDAVATRQWWERMEAKKPTRFNVDYWRAKGALCWVEGNLLGANEAWAKCEAVAQKFPKAGLYEFDRHLNGLLREAIDGEAAAGPLTA
jgi:hypothetical protein